jgi:hypothetical protein
MHRVPLRTALLAVLIATAAIGAAKPPFLKVFMAYYKINPNSAIGKARCLNCHQFPGPPRRNPYGLAVGAALFQAQSRMVTPEMLKSIENKDMGEGLSFLAKIKHDMPPGQPKPKTAKPAPKPTKRKPVKKAKGKSKSKKHALFLPTGSGTAFLMCLAPLGLLVWRRSEEI